MKKNNEVSKYIEKQKSPQKEILKKLRDIILRLPSVKEQFRMGVPWYEGKFYLVALNDHVNLGLSINGLTKKEINMLEGGGKTMKHIKFREVTDIDEKSISKILKMVKRCKSSCVK